MNFSKNFLWGSAISAYQTEGNNQFSDWWHWEIKRHLERSAQACDFWEQYPLYLKFLKQGGQNALRLSLEWARINPEEDRWNNLALEHYLKIIQQLKKNQIEPIVTLWHFSLPEWLAKRGGWLNKESLSYWQRYLEKVKATLGQEIHYWLTLNEPSIYLFKSYLEGSWPPGQKGAIFKALRIRKRLIQAHQLAYQLLKNEHNQISLALNLSFDEANCFLGRWVINWLQRYTDWGILTALKDKAALDFVGINYYFHNLIQLNLWPTENKKEQPCSDLGWEIYPPGIARVAERAYQLSKKPILITENGLADKEDKNRPAFLRDHLFWLQQAVKRGVPILGYLYWSLMDNFEWALGREPRFGLLRVDYQKQSIIPRPSFWVYKKLIESYSQEEKIPPP